MNDESMELPPQRKAYSLSHMIQYLNQIEECIQSSTTPSPAIKYQHVYNHEESKSFYKIVSPVLAKPMLRTLILSGGDGDDVDKNSNLQWKNRKIYFDRRIREARAHSEGTRMYSFVMNLFRPAVLALDSSIREEKVPNLLEQIDLIKQKIGDDTNTHAPMVWGAATNHSIFHRLASGRQYKGKLQDLISDLFPHLYDKYLEASRKSTEREVLIEVLESDLIESTTYSPDVIEQRANAAYTCLDKFYPTEATSERQDSNGLEEGIKCEKSCISFLEDEYKTALSGQGIQPHAVLQNVYVNARRNVNQKQQKYVPPKTNGRNKKSGSDSSGVIWNNAPRHRMTSEFDAVVLGTKENDNRVESDNNNAFIESIWEAKKTISPSTLHDIISKKLGAVFALLDDDGAELTYIKGEGGETTIPFNSGSQLTFGIYGSELQRPENAADSIRSIAGSNVINSDVDAVVRSLERLQSDGNSNDEVLVEVKLADALGILRGLKLQIERFDQEQVAILLFVEEKVEFL